MDGIYGIHSTSQPASQTNASGICLRCRLRQQNIGYAWIFCCSLKQTHKSHLSHKSHPLPALQASIYLISFDADTPIRRCALSPIAVSPICRFALRHTPSARVQIKSVVAQKADQRHSVSLSEVDRERGRRANSSHDRDPRHETLLNQLEAGASTDQ